MRIFFVKAASFLVGLSLLSSLLGSLADRVAPLDDWRAEHRRAIASLGENKEMIEAITLGNSHSDSLDYSVMEIEGQSLAIAAADLFEVEKYAAVLDDELPKLRTVFIAISYYSFSRDNARLQSLRSRRIGFYSMVPVWTPIKGDFQNFLFGKADTATHIMSIVRSDHWLGVWASLGSDAPLAVPFPYEGIYSNSVWGKCYHYTEEQLEVHAQEIANRNVSSSLQMAEAHPGLVQDSFEALARTIEWLQSRNVEVILFTPTYHQKYNSYFEEQGYTIIEEMRQAIGRLQKTYQLSYYDFSSDLEITRQPELFHNSDHLNTCGRKVLSKKLLDKMSEKSKLGTEGQLKFEPNR